MECPALTIIVSLASGLNNDTPTENVKPISDEEMRCVQHLIAQQPQAELNMSQVYLAVLAQLDSASFYCLLFIHILRYTYWGHHPAPQARNTRMLFVGSKIYLCRKSWGK